MPWTTRIGTCSKCGTGNTKLHPTYGEWICFTCKDNRPHKGRGGSGLTNTGITNYKPNTPDLCLVRVPKSDGLFGKLFFEHYPQSKGIPGRSMCYLVYKDYQVCGIIGVNSPPRRYKKFVEFFDSNDANLIVNNNIFKLINHEKNLGTKVLRLFRGIVRKDYLEKYGENLLGIITFVEPPRDGAIYKADNWSFLGETKGLRVRINPETWESEYTTGTQKLIFAYKYKGDRL